jgi:hypothetical protein
MRRRLLPALAVAVVTLGACADLSGLSDLSIEDSKLPIHKPSGKDAGHDVEQTLWDAPADGTAQDSAPRDARITSEAMASEDSNPLDSSPSDTSLPDESSLHDSSTKGDSSWSDACGSIDTVENCGACGATCDTTTATGESCNSGTCAYVCDVGRSDCNMSGRNTDGCECPTPGCCGDACETGHSNGVGDTYWDCSALGTYNETSALAACTAFTSNASECVVFDCLISGQVSICSAGSASTCICWEYQGSNQGRVYNAESPGELSCSCPTAASPTWN